VLPGEFLVCCICVDIGTTADEIIEGLAAVTARKVFGKFFTFEPKSDVRLGQWLDSWIKIGKLHVNSNNKVPFLKKC